MPITVPNLFFFNDLLCGIELMGGWPLAFYIPGATGNVLCPRSLVHFRIVYFGYKNGRLGHTEMVIYNFVNLLLRL